MLEDGDIGIEVLLSGPTVFDAIRAVHPTTPILILGGHTHIRDCCKHPEKCALLYDADALDSAIGWAFNGSGERPVHGNRW
jgi:hypothetical protein